MANHISTIGRCGSCQNILCKHPQTRKDPRGTCCDWTTPQAEERGRKIKTIKIESITDYEKRMGIVYPEVPVHTRYLVVKER